MLRDRLALAIICGLAVLSLSACRGGQTQEEPITIKEIEAHIRALSSDLLEGRAVGTKGIEIAARYQEDYFKTFGLQPAFGASYRQTFSLRGAKPDPLAFVEVASPTFTFTPVLYDDVVINSKREDSPSQVMGELVYCGFLIQAPERNWDDVKGADLKGKVLMAEVNEPGNRPGGIFDGEDMTYYGRWPCKFEKAAELGAAGILLVHSTKGAGYGWEALRNATAGETFFLPDKKQPLFFEGWVSSEAADKICRGVRLDRAALLARAETSAFVPVPLGLTVKVRQKPVFRTVEGVNVAGMIRAKAPDARHRTIILSAHYDHLGKDETLKGDQIFNGAVDNCSATASLLALAGYYAQRPEKLRDDLCFVAVTAEEKLMLGSDYFARHLPFPVSSAVADLNFEMTNVWGETEDVFAIGGRHSDLDDICRQAAERLGLRYTPERNGELGFFFRSDQLSFVKAGIPGVWLHQGIVARGPDPGLVQRKFEDYQKTKYHKVTDEIQPDWDLRGTLQIIRWAEEIITVLSESNDLPQFKPTSSFKRIG